MKRGFGLVVVLSVALGLTLGAQADPIVKTSVSAGDVMAPSSQFSVLIEAVTPGTGYNGVSGIDFRVYYNNTMCTLTSVSNPTGDSDWVLDPLGPATADGSQGPDTNEYKRVSATHLDSLPNVTPLITCVFTTAASLPETCHSVLTRDNGSDPFLDFDLNTYSQALNNLTYDNSSTAPFEACPVEEWMLY